MKNAIYTYLPEMKKTFRCRVPMEGITQVFLVDGVLQEIPANLPDGISLSSGVEGLGVEMRVAARTQESAPVQVISVRKENFPQPLVFANRWVVEEGARAQIVVCDHTLETYQYHTIRNTQIIVEKDAALDILFMQNEHKTSRYVLNIQANLAENARLDCHLLSLYGGVIENNLDVTMNHPLASCDLSGLYLADGTQQIDYKVNVIHQSGKCNSTQLFKGILDNQSRASFHGLIKVAPDAQQTVAYQANHNLMLTKEAKVVSQPQLEIYADDVVCSHGSSIGMTDPLGLFYLRSRGIPLEEAQMLQQMAFVQDVLGKVKTQAIRERLEKMVESRLRGDFSRCSHCTMHCC